MTLDLIVIGILLVSAIVAFMRGFVREVLTIGSLVGAAVATWLLGPSLIPTVSGWMIDPEAKEPQQLFDLIPYEMLVPVIAFAIVFTLVLIGLTLLTHMLSKGVHAIGLGPVDRSLGVAFGLVRGFILIGLMAVVLNFVFSEKQREQYFGDSKTYPYVTYTADLMHALLPGRDTLDKSSRDILAVTGKQPLEPGQLVGKARTRNTQAQNLAPAAGAPQSPRARQFND